MGFRDVLLASIADRRFEAVLSADDEGILSGVDDAVALVSQVGATLHEALEEGAPVERGTEILRYSGSPDQLATIEETLPGLVAKPSGVASAARRACYAAGDSIDVVCGAFKKQPPSLKTALRRAVETGGVRSRMVDSEPFVYLDKNYVRMLGGVVPALAAAARFEGHEAVIQLRGPLTELVDQAREAIEHGAAILMVDTGNVEDARAVRSLIDASPRRDVIQLAFSGGVQLTRVAAYATIGIDILDIGRDIIDAPMLDTRIDVTREI